MRFLYFDIDTLRPDRLGFSFTSGRPYDIGPVYLVTYDAARKALVFSSNQVVK